MKAIRYLKYVLLTILLISSCGTESFVEPEFLNPPFDLKVFPKNNKIKVRFYSSNSESKFDGFNIYISQSSSLRNQYGLLPVRNPSYGGIPTINSTTAQIDPNIPIEVTIDRDGDDNPIENGIKYYLIVKAHSIRNYKSEPGNEASTTPRVDNLIGLSIYNNEGFNFNNSTKTPPYNFTFEIISNTPCLRARNSSIIQSKGYHANWEEVNIADENGYVNSTVPIQINNGHVILIKTADNRYGKIQIKEFSIAPAPYIKIIWAFQKNYNNRDI